MQQSSTDCFSSIHGAFTKLDHILDHKRKFSKFLKIKIIWDMFSEHHGVKVERGKRKKIKKSLNMVRLNNVSLNNP